MVHADIAGGVGGGIVVYLTMQMGCMYCTVDCRPHALAQALHMT